MLKRNRRSAGRNGKREKARYRREKGYKSGANLTAVRHNTLETWRMSQRGDGHVKENVKAKDGGSRKRAF